MSITAVEASIVARLRETVQDAQNLVLKVYSHSDYADVAEAQMVQPSLAVIYAGYKPLVNPGNAAHIQLIEFSFTIVLNVYSANQSDTGQGVRDEVSPIFDAVLDALLGFRPIQKFKPLQLQPAPGAALSEAGFGYYPLQFSTTATYRGTT